MLTQKTKDTVTTPSADSNRKEPRVHYEVFGPDLFEE